MMDCKAMSTPMVTNLNLLSDTSSETMDTTMYRQMIGSLMYNEHKAKYMLCCEYIESVYG
jgi:hypothetical protein